METLLSLLLWAGLMVLMIRLGRGSHPMGQESAGQKGPNESERGVNLGLRWVPPAKDADPVCGETVTTAKAKPSVHAGLVYYFCSRECREVFEAAPDLYVGHRHDNRPELEHSHA